MNEENRFAKFTQGGGDNKGHPGKPGENIKVVTSNAVKNPPDGIIIERSSVPKEENNKKEE